MRSIADAAGVSLPTIELAFATKANLLKAAIDFAIANDDEPVPMLSRDWAVAAHQAPAPADVVAGFARALREAHIRSASLIIVADEAARTDDTIAALTRHLTQQRVATVTWIIDELRRRTPLRSGITRKQAIDVLWLLMEPYTFHRLTTLRGWNARQFERWFVDSACRLVLPGHDG
jgi:TetR/AcrR family transcriptional regulator, regulator of autoinduction and epiphytic fitness